MPLVRIVSHAGEASQALAEELRSRGFDIESVLPGHKSSLIADVEIHLNDCPVHEALQRVETVAEIASQNADAAAKNLAASPESTHSDWPIWQVEDKAQSDHQDAVPPSLPYTADDSSAMQPSHSAITPIVTGRLVRVRVPAKDRWFWRVAAGTAACALFGLLMVATLHRLSPFSGKLPGAQANTTQAEPFQRIDDVAGDALDMHPLQNASMRADEPVRSEGSSRHHTRRHHSSPYHQDDSFVAADTVVRFNRPIRKASSASDSSVAGIKRYSDLKQ